MVLDELDLDDDNEKITKEAVVKRVDDWLARIESLFIIVENWCGQNGWSFTRGDYIPMHEEMMQIFGVDCQSQPTVQLHSPDGGEVWFRPKGLWVIGANGRVDVFSNKGVFVLVDKAAEFDTPKWRLHRLGEVNGRDFSPELIAEMVRNA